MSKNKVIENEDGTTDEIIEPEETKSKAKQSKLPKKEERVIRHFGVARLFLEEEDRWVLILDNMRQDNYFCAYEHPKMKYHTHNPQELVVMQIPVELMKKAER